MIKLLPIGKYDYALFPIMDRVVEIDDYGNEFTQYIYKKEVIEVADEILAVIRKTKKFENGQVVDMTQDEIGYQQLLRDKQGASEEIEKLEQLLNDTDYKAFKYIDGEVKENEWQAIKAQRKNSRARIRELKHLIASLF